MNHLQDHTLQGFKTINKIQISKMVEINLILTNNNRLSNTSQQLYTLKTN